MEERKEWHGRPYYSLDAWCRNTYRHKCYKVALNAHMSCPNRDGTLDTRGCLFCSAGGSGDFAVDLPSRRDRTEDIAPQLEQGIRLIENKLADPENTRIIAYFQAYTNTYAPLPYLERVYSAALDSPRVCGLSIATRPDCLPDQVLDLLVCLRKRFPGKFIWIELGLQTVHEDTALLIRRGYRLPCFQDAAERLSQADIPFITHVILGLPGESPDRTLETVDYLNRIRPFGVKLQLLHVLEGTDLAGYYREGRLTLLTKEAYLDLLIRCIETLSPDIVLHRVTGDGPGKLLIAPAWSRNKRDVLNSLHALMRRRASFQGRLWTP